MTCSHNAAGLLFVLLTKRAPVGSGMGEMESGEQIGSGVYKRGLPAQGAQQK